MLPSFCWRCDLVCAPSDVRSLRTVAALSRAQREPHGRGQPMDQTSLSLRTGGVALSGRKRCFCSSCGLVVRCQAVSTARWDAMLVTKWTAATRSTSGKVNFASALSVQSCRSRRRLGDSTARTCLNHARNRNLSRTTR